MTIDFYAQAKIGDLGKDNLGFTMPAGGTVMDPDPVAILKGAPKPKLPQDLSTLFLAQKHKNFSLCLKEVLAVT